MQWIPLTSDSYEEIRPAQKGCEIEQMFNYTKTGVLLSDEDILEKMDSTNKAAAVVHEWIYFLLRGYGETNSIRTRRTVGLLFSGQVIKAPWQDLPYPEIVCHSPEPPVGVMGIRMTELHIYKSPQTTNDDDFLVQFDSLNGTFMIGAQRNMTMHVHGAKTIDDVISIILNPPASGYYAGLFLESQILNDVDLETTGLISLTGTSGKLQLKAGAENGFNGLVDCYRYPAK